MKRVKKMKRNKWLILALVLGIIFSSFNFDSFSYATAQVDKIKDYINPVEEQGSSFLVEPTPPPPMVINHEPPKAIEITVANAVYGLDILSVAGSVYETSELTTTSVSILENEIELSKEEILHWFSKGMTIQDLLEATVIGKSYGLPINEVLQNAEAGQSFQQQRIELAKAWLNGELDAPKTLEVRQESFIGKETANNTQSRAFPLTTSKVEEQAYSAETAELILKVYASYANLTIEEIIEGYHDGGDQFFAKVVQLYEPVQRSEESAQ
ncbi:hypothetical protein [Cohnella sp. GCM10012308]|uniref:hypothetical protein n=1 Tax=Cohnella sp. GCM10012308 TaxID=3317329 RepID=UPI00361A6D40